MKKINSTITFKLFFILIIILFFMTFVLSNLVIYFNDNFYVIWLILLSAFILIAFVIFYIIKKINVKVTYDAKQIIKYLEKITDKNYEAVLKTKHFSEFLQIELLLKNIIKRLHKKDKKK